MVTESKSPDVPRGYLLEAIAFAGGGAIMILELLGSRVLAPFVGTSLWVWTSLIGIILASLSLGYYLGGRISDRSPRLEILSLVIFLAGLYIGLVTFLQRPFLIFLSQSIPGIRMGSTVATVALFAVPSIFLAMIAPYTVRLRMENVSDSGKTVGRLYAVSTIGSIVGTFLAGFWLIPYFGTTLLLGLLALTLIGISFLGYGRARIALRALTALCVVFGLILEGNLRRLEAELGFVDVDTQYSRVLVYDSEFMGSPARFMAIARQTSSVMSLQDPDQVFGYARFFDLVQYFVPEARRALMLGGAAFTYSRHFLNAVPGSTIDVVEIDPGVTALAKKYFGLTDRTDLTVIHADARVFLNQTDRKYDVVFIDAFTSVDTVPYQLTTVEAIERIFAVLEDGGAVFVNLLSSVQGPAGMFLRAEFHTYAEVFPQVHVLRVGSTDGRVKQNLVLMAIKSDTPARFDGNDAEWGPYLQTVWRAPVAKDLPILTDDHAPVDRYIAEFAR